MKSQTEISVLALPRKISAARRALEKSLLEMSAADAEDAENGGKPFLTSEKINLETELSAIATIDLAELEELAEYQLALDQIALMMGMRPVDLAQAMEDHENVRMAYLRGSARGISLLTMTMYQKARLGETRALMFMLERKGGWAVPMHTKPDEPPRVMISTQNMTLGFSDNAAKLGQDQAKLASLNLELNAESGPDEK